MDPFLPDEAKLHAIRELLPSLGSGIRLDVTMAGPFPAETDRAIRQLAEHEQRVGRGGAERAEELDQRQDEACSVIAAVLSTTPDRVLLAPGPIAALSALLLAGGPSMRGDVAIVGELTETLTEALSAVAEAHGTPVRRGDRDLSPDTALVLASHVDPMTGRVLDTRPLADRAHAVGATLLLDAGWSVGAIPVDAATSGADLILMETHRWLLGPEGVAALWMADAGAAGRVRALVDRLPLWQLVGVARSLGWLLMYVSLPWAFERTESLAMRLRRALAACDALSLSAAPRDVAATVAFAIPRWSAAEAAAELRRRAHVLLDVDVARGLLVASVGAWLREDEIDRFAEAVVDLAAHSPETLPRRPLLTVLAPGPRDDR